MFTHMCPHKPQWTAITRMTVPGHFLWFDDVHVERKIRGLSWHRLSSLRPGVIFHDIECLPGINSTVTIWMMFLAEVRLVVMMYFGLLKVMWSRLLAHMTNKWSRLLSHMTNPRVLCAYKMPQQIQCVSSISASDQIRYQRYSCVIICSRQIKVFWWKSFLILYKSMNPQTNKY